MDHVALAHMRTRCVLKSTPRIEFARPPMAPKLLLAMDWGLGTSPGSSIEKFTSASHQSGREQRLQLALSGDSPRRINHVSNWE
jgi:hypothetical protein